MKRKMEILTFLTCQLHYNHSLGITHINSWLWVFIVFWGIGNKIKNFHIVCYKLCSLPSMLIHVEKGEGLPSGFKLKGGIVLTKRKFKFSLLFWNEHIRIRISIRIFVKESQDKNFICLLVGEIESHL